MTHNHELLSILSHEDIKCLEFECTNGDCGQFAIALSKATGYKYSIFAVLNSEMFEDSAADLEQCESDEDEYRILCQEGMLCHLFVHDGVDFFDISGQISVDDLGDYDDHNPEPVLWRLGFPDEELEELVINNTAWSAPVDYYEMIIKKVMEDIENTTKVTTLV